MSNFLNVLLLALIFSNSVKAQTTEYEIELAIKETIVNQDLGIGPIGNQPIDRTYKCTLAIDVSQANFELKKVEKGWDKWYASETITTTTLNVNEAIDFRVRCENEEQSNFIKKYLKQNTVFRGRHQNIWERPYPEYAKEKKVLKDEFGCWRAHSEYDSSHTPLSELLEDFRKTLYVDSCKDIPFNSNKLVFNRIDGGFLILENGQIRGASGAGFFSGTYQIK